MKTWKTITLSIITTSTLVTATALTYSYLQPSHYEGTTFKNEQSTGISNVSTNNTIHDNIPTTESNNTTTTSPSNHTESITPKQVAGARAYQPTFEVKCVSAKSDLYTVTHIPTGDTTKAITYKQAENFYQYMEQIAYGKTSLSYTMNENYNTYLTNNNN